ncbi:MAG TPA: SDR family oxidoreductase [Solirubrobacteraceae bacterium]|nr:SDR family oxidoreductase [Solirubrobacteraceae bacterium]
MTSATAIAPTARTVLLTGATGMVGVEVLARLLERDDVCVVTVLRAADDEQARRRLDGLLLDVLGLDPALRGRTVALAGDVARPGLGLSAPARDRVLATVDGVIHSAASVAFDMPLPEARAVNVGGTHAVLSLARELAWRGRLRRLVHVSTAYVAGDHPGRFREDQAWAGQSFRNTYEQSKLEAELLLASAGADLPLVVARPSIVVGDARSGWTAAFHGLYGPLRAFARGLIRRIPAAPEGLVDTVPLDYVGAGIVHLLDAEDVGGVVALAAGDGAVTVRDLVALASRTLGDREPPVLDPAARDESGSPVLLPYFDVRTRFDTRRAAAVLGRAGLRPVPLAGRIDALLRYASAAAWGRRPVDRRSARAGTLAAA